MFDYFYLYLCVKQRTIYIFGFCSNRSFTEEKIVRLISIVIGTYIWMDLDFLTQNNGLEI